MLVGMDGAVQILVQSIIVHGLVVVHSHCEVCLIILDCDAEVMEVEGIFPKSSALKLTRNAHGLEEKETVCS